MDLQTPMKQAATYIYKKFSTDPGNLLLITGTVGWILSSLAHVSGIIINKEISPDQKKFLIPQELADGAVNIASFFAITHAATLFGKYLVKSGKLTTPKIMKFLEANKLTSKIGEKKFDISESDVFENLSSEDGKEFQKHYFNIEDGVAFIASTTGSIISSNIITPILRNKFAADRQKKSINEDKQHELGIPKAPVLPAQNRFGIEDYKKKTSGAPLFMPSGSMRV